MSHSHSDTVPLHASSQSDIDEIENLINATVHSGPATVLPARPPAPPRPDPRLLLPLPPFLHPPEPPRSSPTRSSSPPWPGGGRPPPPLPPSGGGGSGRGRGHRVRAGPEHAHGAGLGHGEAGHVEDREQFEAGGVPEPVPGRPREGAEGLGSLGPFFFIVFLGLVLSWSASVKKSEVFAVAFAVLAAGAVILTLNVLLLGGHIIFFQSLSLLGYCLFPLDVGALICLLKDNVILKVIVVSVTLAWSSWAAYPFMSSAVNPRRKALALYPVFLMYVSVGFLIIAID
ncbi:hypothetical protein BT93_C1479 [Corymbia citriodora subsp. variegata]|nr:hypothetical protein BT93_C1479 [Corymbia citriodora subsp. variegata]